MDRKNDPQIQENVDRGEENEQTSSAGNSRSNSANGEDANKESEQIKDANAAGLGAMGRNDQQQTADTFNKLADQGNE